MLMIQRAFKVASVHFKEGGVFPPEVKNGRVEDHIVVSQAELPRKLAEMVAAVVREELAKCK